MDIILKAQELITAQISFVVVRIFTHPKNDIGSKLIVTAEDSFGKLCHFGLEQKLIEQARKILLARKSQVKKLTWKKGEVKAFFECYGKNDQIVIVGAGHIALALSPLAKTLGFDIAILDDREDYANVARFPQADKVLVGPFSQTLQSVAIDAQTYLVLVTRGHVHDKDCLKIVLEKGAAYIGMIGSTRRLTGVFKLMEQEGYQKQQLEKIHAPIGLPIGGDSPEEIALSILAEIVSVRYQGQEWSLGLKKDYYKKKT